MKITHEKEETFVDGVECWVERKRGAPWKRQTERFSSPNDGRINMLKKTDIMKEKSQKDKTN